ncbi:MAG: pitrilysin family protein [Bacillota bacterium]
MVHRRKLQNGIRIITEPLTHYRSACLGVWIGTGSIRESARESGASHFIEHMLFKGTPTRSASDIAAQMDGIGGTLNAFTSKDCTCFYAKVLDEHLEKAVDLLSDIVLNSSFDEKEIEKEKGVVCEEILMMEDSPEDLAHESLSDVYFEDGALSKPILGSVESVRGFTRDVLLSYMKSHYTPENTVISCAGNVSEERVAQLVEERFKAHSGPGRLPPFPHDVKPGNRFKAVEKDVEQVHICIGMPGYGIDRDGQYPLFVLNNALGGSMSSRLFQKIREEKGLAYSVYSYPVSYVGVGCFAMYAGTGEKQAVQVVDLMLEELRRMRKEGLTREEFIRSKEQLKGNFLLGQEGTSGRMNAIGKSELLLGKVYTEEERLAQIEGITMDHVMGILPEVLDGTKICAAAVGRVKEHAEQIRERILQGL